MDRHRLDFLIVVVGVFIGIQVANWNDARQMRVDQRTFLEQLHADLAPSIEFWRTGNDRLTEEDASERYVLEAITKGALSDDDTALFNAGLVSLVNSYGMDVSLRARHCVQSRFYGSQSLSRAGGSRFDPSVRFRHFGE